MVVLCGRPRGERSCVGAIRFRWMSTMVVHAHTHTHTHTDWRHGIDTFDDRESPHWCASEIRHRSATVFRRIRRKDATAHVKQTQSALTRRLLTCRLRTYNLTPDKTSSVFSTLTKLHCTSAPLIRVPLVSYILRIQYFSSKICDLLTYISCVAFFHFGPLKR